MVWAWAGREGGASHFLRAALVSWTPSYFILCSLPPDLNTTVGTGLVSCGGPAAEDGGSGCAQARHPGEGCICQEKACLTAGLPRGALQAGGFPALRSDSSPIPALTQRKGQMEWGILGSREQFGSPTLPPPSELGRSEHSRAIVAGELSPVPDSVPVLQRSLDLCEDKRRATLPPDSSPVPKPKTAGTLFLLGMLCWQDSQPPPLSPSF